MKANTTSIEAVVTQNQLCWAGHCIRMSDNSLPRQVIFTQLTQYTRTCGGHRERFKDTAKHYIKKGQFDINGNISLRIVHSGAAKFESNHLLHVAEKRQRRKEREMSQHLHFSLPSGTSCPHCNKIGRSRIGLLSHLRTHG